MEEIKLNETQKGIIAGIKENPRVTQRELSRKLNVDSTTINRNIRILKLLGIVKRHGPCYKDVDRYWEVLK